MAQAARHVAYRLRLRPAILPLFFLVASLPGGAPARATTLAPIFPRIDSLFIENQVAGDLDGEERLDLAGPEHLVETIQVRMNNGASTSWLAASRPWQAHPDRHRYQRAHSV